jgi:hypothetical protein
VRSKSSDYSRLHLLAAELAARLLARRRRGIMQGGRTQDAAGHADAEPSRPEDVISRDPADEHRK